MKSLLVLLVFLGLVAGCTFSPKTHFYALNGLPVNDVDERRNPSFPTDTSMAYGVGPVFLPEALNQPGVVAHREGQQVSVSLYNIWAGNLRDGVTRVLANNLSELTGIDGVWPFPWDNRKRPERQVRVVFEQLSGELGGEVVLKAKWALTEDNGETSLVHRRVSFREAVSAEGYGSYVDAINRLVNHLSKDIAQTISQLPVVERSAPENSQGLVRQ